LGRVPPTFRGLGHKESDIVKPKKTLVLGIVVVAFAIPVFAEPFDVRNPPQEVVVCRARHGTRRTNARPC